MGSPGKRVNRGLHGSIAECWTRTVCREDEGKKPGRAAVMVARQAAMPWGVRGRR